MGGETLGDVIRRLGRLSGLHGDLAQTDAQLLDRFARRHDEAAFAALMARHGPMVLGVCRRLLHDSQEAEDAFQAAFLILARKAGGVRRQALLGGWLYGVAYKVAARLRGRAARRRERVQSGVDLDTLPADPVACRDMEAIVHEEVGRLPDKYRNAVILCHLEGKTNEEAAVLLRRPVGTVKSRLTRARELLRTRLTRRGMALSGGALTAALAVRPAPAPAALLDATIHAATRFAVGEAAAGGLASARAVALTQGVLRTMILTKLKIAAALALAVALFGGAGGLAYHSWAAAPGDAPKVAAHAEKPPAADPPKDDAAKNKPKDEADAQKIQGTWVAVSAEMDGKAASAEAIKDLSISVTADKVAFNPGGENRQSAYKLDPTKTPKVIELTPQDGPGKGKMVHCLYELDGDRLKLCLLNGPGEEPKEFATTPGSNLRLLILKRKPADDKPKDDKEALQGAWRVESVQVAGEDATDRWAGTVREWVVNDAAILFHNGVTEHSCPYKLDPDKTPNEINITPMLPAYTRSQERGPPNRGVYSLDGDVWKVCFPAGTNLAQSGGDDVKRPKEVASVKQYEGAPPVGTILITLRRVKDPVDKPDAKAGAAPDEDITLSRLIRSLGEGPIRVRPAAHGGGAASEEEAVKAAKRAVGVDAPPEKAWRVAVTDHEFMSGLVDDKPCWLLYYPGAVKLPLSFEGKETRTLNLYVVVDAATGRLWETFTEPEAPWWKRVKVKNEDVARAYAGRGDEAAANPDPPGVPLLRLLNARAQAVPDLPSGQEYGAQRNARQVVARLFLYTTPVDSEEQTDKGVRRFRSHDRQPVWTIEFDGVDLPPPVGPPGPDADLTPDGPKAPKEERPNVERIEVMFNATSGRNLSTGMSP